MNVKIRTDPDIPFLRIFVSNFRHFVFAVRGGKKYSDKEPKKGPPSPEPVFLNVHGAQESIPRNEFRQPI
jgi:hypothetical protein